MNRTLTLRYLVLVFVLAPGPFLGCDSTDPDADAVSSTASAALLQLDKTWAAATAAGDASRVITFWTDDAVNYFPGAPPAVGKAAIAELMQRNRSLPGFSIKTEPRQAVVSSDADLGYTSGTFQLTLDGPAGTPIVRSGNYVNIWKRQPDGSWKCAVTIGTPSG